MNNLRSEKRIAILIILLAMILRLILCYYNRQANDNHVDVVSWIVDKHELPEKKDCWSCYQPKLYYLICAGIVQVLGVHGDSERILIMQLVNVFFSLFM